MIFIHASCAANNSADEPAGSGSTGSGGAPTENGTTTTATGKAEETTGGLITGCTNALSCSDDLRSVTCDGAVVKQCPEGQQCNAGACSDLCKRAADEKSSAGCEFYVSNPDTVAEGACFAVFVTNNGKTAVKLGVDRDGQSFEAASFMRIPKGSGASLTYTPLPNGELPPGEVAILFLAYAGDPADDLVTACPKGIKPAFTKEDAAVHLTGLGKAFHLQSSAPIVAYSVFPFGGGSSAVASASLLLPTSVWGQNYVGIATYKPYSLGNQAAPWLQVVAAQNDTQVTLSPTAAIKAGQGVSASPQGTPVTFTLQAGDYLQLSQANDLTGTPIQADKPIGLFGGNRCMLIPNDSFLACDAGHQMIPPVKALGSEYVGVRYRNRFPAVEESPPWRIMGLVNDTKLTFDPAPPAPAIPSVIQQGQVVEFSAPGPFIVKTQDAAHPLFVSAHMTGCQEVGPYESDCRGDPESVIVVPTGQFLRSYIFFTDPTYPETNLVFVRKRGKDGFKDVTLECAGTLGGWKPIGTSGEYEYTRFDVVTGNFKPQGQCDNGRHRAFSEEPFGVTVWAWGSAASETYSQACSYAYPAGTGVELLSSVEVPAVPK